MCFFVTYDNMYNHAFQMAKELDAILDHGEANRAASCITESGSVSFLEQIICPIYQTIALVSGTDYQTPFGKVLIITYYGRSEIKCAYVDDCLANFCLQ